MVQPNRLTLHRALSVGDFRRMAIEKVIEIIRTLQVREESPSGAADQTVPFVARRTVSLIRFRSIDELKAAFDEELGRLKSLWKTSNPTFDEVASALKEPFDRVVKGPENGLRVLDAYTDLLRVEEDYGGVAQHGEDRECRITADATHIYFFIDDKELERQVEWQEGVADAQFLVSVSLMIQAARAAKRQFTPSETAIVQAAYELLGQGRTVTAAYRGLGIPGFKHHQTLLFATDPGEGHLRVTCHDGNLLAGAAVHIEHIDRDEGTDREKVEPYRLPAAVNAAKVRLHVGSEAPCTAYIGRPVFENWSPKSFDGFSMDKLKSVHMTASACTAMFMNGIVDCKIGLERMTATQAVEFMQSVVGNVFRDRCRQYLSAAINIHTPILDDRAVTKKANGDKPRLVSTCMELAHLGIDLVAEGGFDKVAWDGSETNVFPSVPILEQLDCKQVVELVHRAHERGLTTYVSAGLLAKHMPAAVQTGLDGVGIGVSLHYVDEKKAKMGELRAEAILAVLQQARQAEKTVLGRAAKLLARLDRLHYEGILRPGDESVRADLYKALRDGDEARIETLLGKLVSVEKMPGDDPLEHTCVGRARRLLGAEASAPAGASLLEGGPDLRRRLERVAAGEHGRDPSEFVLYHRDFSEFIGLIPPKGVTP
jgi:hypothetical protein